MPRASNIVAGLVLGVVAIGVVLDLTASSHRGSLSGADRQAPTDTSARRSPSDRPSATPAAKSDDAMAGSGEPAGTNSPETPAGSDRDAATDELARDAKDQERESLDEAADDEIEFRLTRAIDRAREERDVFIAPGLVEQLLEHGEVRVIVAERRARETLLEHLAGSRHGEPRYFHTIPYVALSVGPQALLSLVESGDVTAIEVDSINYPSLSETIPIIGADAAVEAGYDGTDWVIAILDTGIQLDHPFLGGRVIDGACFSLDSDCPNGERSMLGLPAGVPCGFSCEHGTHVAGVAAGYDGDQPLSGVAPGASLISIQVFSESEEEPNEAAAHTSDIIAALEHVYGLRVSYPIAAVNLSLGGDVFYNSASECDAANGARKAIIDLLRSAGIATIVSSGNDKLTDLLSAPACISSAISVGATDDRDVPASFSNSASYLDLLAPGRFVYTSDTGDGFATVSGTSMSAPHVSAAVADILVASPESSVSDILHALRSTGTLVTDNRNGVTTPRINLLDAIDFLLDGGTASEPEEPTADEPSRPVEETSDCGLVGLELLVPLLIARRSLPRRRRAH